MLNVPKQYPVHRVKVAIVGSGLGGLATAIRLKQSGEYDFVVLERAEEVGGVWRDNLYPGCACDVESHLYSLSFVPNPNWSEQFSRQPEILAYIKRCTRDAGVLPHIRFSTDVGRMTWDEAAGEWTVETSQGGYRARYLVLATGGLSEPLVPNIQDLERFRGRVFHSANWPSDLDLAGKRVAVVGTGASAVQFIPVIQPQVARLQVFQRTAPWIMPRHDGPISGEQQARYRRYPWRRWLTRAGLYLHREMLAFLFHHPGIMRKAQHKTLKHMQAVIKDPDLRRKLTPNYTQGCKRILFSNTYYPAMAQPNVELIPAGVERVTPSGVVAADGLERPADVIIFGTGFQVKDPAFAHQVVGNGGASLAKVWAGSPKSFAGTTVHGFPNLFMLLGPNTALAHSSVIIMMEAQIEHALSVIRFADRQSRSVIEPRLRAQQQFTRHVDRKMRGTVWTAGGCNSWYLDATGRNSSLWPGYTFTFRHRFARMRPRDYEVRQSSNPPTGDC